MRLLALVFWLLFLFGCTDEKGAEETQEVESPTELQKDPVNVKEASKEREYMNFLTLKEKQINRK